MLSLKQSPFTRYVGQRTVSIVTIQHVLAEIRDKQVHKSVVVVVADAYTLPPAGAHEISLCSHIRECAVTIVFVEVICRLLTLWETAESPAIDNEYVEPSVIVIIE